MTRSKILILSIIIAGTFLIGIIGLMTTAGHETGDEWFGHDHHDGEECEEHHHFFEFWNNDHHHGHHHEEDHNDECPNEESEEI